MNGIFNQIQNLFQPGPTQPNWPVLAPPPKEEQKQQQQGGGLDLMQLISQIGSMFGG